MVGATYKRSEGHRLIAAGGPSGSHDEQDDRQGTRAGLVSNVLLSVSQCYTARVIYPPQMQRPMYEPEECCCALVCTGVRTTCYLVQDWYAAAGVMPPWTRERGLEPPTPEGTCNLGVLICQALPCHHGVVARSLAHRVLAVWRGIITNATGTLAARTTSSKYVMDKHPHVVLLVHVKQRFQLTSFTCVVPSSAPRSRPTHSAYWRASFCIKLTNKFNCY